MRLVVQTTESGLGAQVLLRVGTMLEHSASQTAMIIAKLRAAHQVLDDDPKVLVDPLALGLVPDLDEEALRSQAASLQTSYWRALRAFAVMRSRYVEDVLQKATSSGTLQYVNVGAGLDTFAYRQPSWAQSLTLFEVDYPATQRWKRGRFQQLAIAQPPNLRWCPINLETTTLATGLGKAEFSLSVPTCFSWLGVTQYLTEAAIASTLRFVASLPPGSSIVFSFVRPETGLDFPSRMIHRISSTAASAQGEPWITEFEPAELAHLLRDLGFSKVIHLTTEAANRRYFADRHDNLRTTGYAELMWAMV